MDHADSEVILSKQYDHRSGVPISVHVVLMVAIASDRRSMDLDPLGRHVNTDHLDMLFSPSFLADAETEVSVTFSYEGYVVDIEEDGTVSLRTTSE